MEHLQLVKMAQTLGYSISDKGLCFGFSFMWARALCIDGNLKNFNLRINLLKTYAANPKLLLSDIEKIKKKKYADLSTKEKILYSVPAFFENLSLYQNPMVGREMFQKFIFQDSSVEVSQKLGDNGFYCNFVTVDQYDEASLSKYLQSMANALESPQSVPIILSANKHSIVLQIIAKNQYRIIDTNDLDAATKIYTTKTLVTKLFETFNNGDQPILNLVSHLYSNDKTLDLSHLRNRAAISNPASNKHGRNIVVNAALYNDVDTLKRFKSIDPKFTANILHISCRRGNLEFVKELIKSSSVDINEKNKEGITPLMAACLSENKDLVQFLLDSHVDLSLCDHTECSALHIAISHSNLEIVSLIIEKLESQKQLSQQINQPNKFGVTPLYAACCSGNLDLVRYLLNKGAEPTVHVGDWSALHVACRNGIEMVQLLVEHNVCITNTILHAVCENEQLEIVNYLIQQGADCNGRKEGMTPLMLAAKNNQMALIPCLLEKTDITREDFNEDSPLRSLMHLCNSKERKVLLIKALQGYIQNKSREEESIFELFKSWVDRSKNQKTQAAECLLAHLINNQPLVNSCLPALTNGNLGFLYQASLIGSDSIKQRLSLLKESQEEIKVAVIGKQRGNNSEAP